MSSLGDLKKLYPNKQRPREFTCSVGEFTSSTGSIHRILWTNLVWWYVFPVKSQVFHVMTRTSETTKFMNWFRNGFLFAGKVLINCANSTYFNIYRKCRWNFYYLTNKAKFTLLWTVIIFIFLMHSVVLRPCTDLVTVHTCRARSVTIVNIFIIIFKYIKLHHI